MTLFGKARRNKGLMFLVGSLGTCCHAMGQLRLIERLELHSSTTIGLSQPFGIAPRGTSNWT